MKEKIKKTVVNLFKTTVINYSVDIVFFFSNLGRDSKGHLHQLYFDYFEYNSFAFFKSSFKDE